MTSLLAHLLLAARGADPKPPFSWLAFASMVVLVGVSAWMFMMLVRRSTSRRQWVSLAQWCRENGFWMRPARRAALPGPLAELVNFDAQVRFHLGDDRTTLLQFETAAAPGEAPPRWNVLVRQRSAIGPIAALRPASAKLNLVDLLPLSEYASLTLGERFVVYATESDAARRLAESALLSLLPQDLGFILLQDHVVLDFTNRPFDPIEFGRIVRLADQLVAVVL